MFTVIVFSHLRWNFVWQRPQQLMSRFAAHLRVVFVEEPVHDTSAPAHLACTAHGPNLQVLVPHTPVDAHGFHDDQMPTLRPLLEDWLHEQGVDECVAWFYTPMALPLVARLHPRMVVYDCVDELSAAKDVPRRLLEREAALLKVADLVLTGGPSLYQAKRPLHPNVHCLPSAVDAAHFAPPRDRDGAEARAAAALQDTLPHPRLGFFGVIDGRIDLALVDHLAVTHPDWQIVMVGPVVSPDPGVLPARANVRWFGPQPYARLPHLMAGWDLCLMPFALDESTRYINPTKTLEYIAGEKPVVSTPVPDVVSLYGDLVSIARDATEFVAACAAALAETPWQRSRRLARMTPTLFRASWSQLVEFLRRLIEQHLARAATGPVAGRALAGAH